MQNIMYTILILGVLTMVVVIIRSIYNRLLGVKPEIDTTAKLEENPWRTAPLLQHVEENPWENQKHQLQSQPRKLLQKTITLPGKKNKNPLHVYGRKQNEKMLAVVSRRSGINSSRFSELKGIFIPTPTKKVAEGYWEITIEYH